MVDHPDRPDCPSASAGRAAQGAAQSSAVAPALATTATKAYAESLVGSAQFACLEPLWDDESGWNPDEVNPSSGAAGIPQFLPSTWADFGYAYFPRDPLVQVQAGLRYIAARYGTPCSAWGFWQGAHWY